MTLYDAIPIRKSIRSYESARLEQTYLDELAAFLSEQEPPLAGIDWDFDILSYDEITQIIAGPPKLLAPHFLVLRSEKKQGCLQNCGYLGELAVLWLTARGFGTCWQGGLEVQKDFPDVLPYVIAVGFGRPAEPLRSGEEEFDRKPLLRLGYGDLKGPLRPALEAARLAPSGMGMQPIRFYCVGNRVHIYRKKPLLGVPQLNFLQCVDAGVSAAHLREAGEALGYRVLLEKLEPAPELQKRLIYQMSARFLTKDEKDA